MTDLDPRATALVLIARVMCSADIELRRASRDERTLSLWERVAAEQPGEGLLARHFCFIVTPHPPRSAGHLLPMGEGARPTVEV